MSHVQFLDMTQPTIDRLFASAERDAEAQNWSAARSGYLRVLELEPAHADAMLQLSYLDSFADRHRSARDWALRASAAVLPSRSEAMLDLIRRLRTFNAVEALRTCTARMMEASRTPTAILTEAASQLSNLNDFETALGCAEAAVQKSPGDLAARLVHGQLLAHFDRIPEAEREIAGVLQRNPGMAIGWWMQARLRTQTQASNHVAQIQAQLKRPKLRPGDVAALARALHKELDDIGAYGPAWQALELMCRARRSTQQYQPEQTRQLFDALISRASSQLPVADATAAMIVPVFIVGMHRSGTTLLEQLLDVSPQVRGLGELTDFTSAMRFAADHYCRGAIDATIVARTDNADLAAVGRQYLESVAWRLDGADFFTDKLPSNFLNIGFICQALPQAKILHMVRDPMETCFSNLRELFSEANAYSYDQVELADYFIQYRRLMAHWHQAYPGRILDVSYAELTADPAATMRQVAEFCGIDFIDAMTDTRSSKRAVATASAVQVREGVRRRDVAKWVPYAKHLQPLMDALRAGGVEVADPAA